MILKIFFLFLQRQIIEAVLELKSLGIYHLDLKEENILLDLDTKKIKLIDFGNSDYVLPADKKFKYIGTKSYAPPEWIKTGYYNGEYATIWSLGILFYTLVYDKLPFEDDAAIICGKLPELSNPSVDDLILKILTNEPEKRIKLEEMLDHKCFEGIK